MTGTTKGTDMNEETQTTPEVRPGTWLAAAVLAVSAALNAPHGEPPIPLDRLSERSRRGLVGAVIAVDRLVGERDRRAGQPEPQGGQWKRISFMGHTEYSGWVTEVTQHGQAAYRIDLPEKVWGGNPLAYVTHAASAWFSDRPVTEESVRAAWEAQVERARIRAEQEAEWAQMQEQRALEAGAEDDDPDAHPDGCICADCEDDDADGILADAAEMDSDFKDDL
jgi:hypothetical protein